MSNILFTFFTPTSLGVNLLCYYEQFSKAFLNKSHDVLMVHQNTFEKSLQKIKEFSPDLIISFNHVITKNIYEITDCPVIAYEVDTIDLFENLDLMKQKQERLFFAVLHRNRINIIKQSLKWLKNERIIVIKNSTLLNTKNCVQDVNISFIGSLVGLNVKNNFLVMNLIKNISNHDYIIHCKEILEKANHNLSLIKKKDLDFLKCSYKDLLSFLSFYSRLGILDNVANLGLQTYGIFYELNSIVNLYDLFFSLKSDKIISLKDNEELYNRSRLSLNVHFAHNIKDVKKSVYSWRVCDIMATNSCLVSIKCPALDQDFGKWVEILQFSNKHEAYDLCKKLLENENLRKDISSSSQLAIKEGKFSFYDRVAELEEIFNLKKNINKTSCEALFLINNSQNFKDKKNTDIILFIMKLFKKLIRIILELNLIRIFKLPLKLYKILKNEKKS